MTRVRWRPPVFFLTTSASPLPPADLVSHPVNPIYARSTRSRFITLFQAATKSWTNFFSESEHP